jgi:hypothetical protein
LSNSIESITVTFADDAVVATDRNPGIASLKLQTNLDTTQKFLRKLGIKANEYNSVHITLTTRREPCPPVHIYSVHLPQEYVV